MLGTTVTLTLNATPYVLNKINNDNYASEYLYKDATEELRFKVRHSKTKNGFDRHNVELTQRVFAADPDPEIFRKAYFVVEQIPSDSDVFLFDALADAAIATSNELLNELQGWVS